MALLAAHPEQAIQAAVVGHPNATEEILHQLFLPHQHLLKQRENLPVSILEKLLQEVTEIPIWKDAHLRHLLLKQSNIPAWILARLTEHDLEEIRADRQNCRPLSPEILEKWVLEATDYLAEIAKHPNVSSETLVQLAEHINSKVRLAVAQNQKTSEQLRLHLLLELIDYSEPHIQVEIASDINTPVTILQQLAEEFSAVNWVVNLIRQVLPNASDSLVNEVKSFITAHESPELISFWLRQDAVFREPIFRQWRQLLANLNESDRITFEALCHQMLPAIGLSGGLPSQDRWIIQYGYPSQEFDLYGLLLWFEYTVNTGNAGINRAVPLALIGNPSLSTALRSRLQNQLTQPVDWRGSHRNDLDMQLALACNLAIPKAERLKYYQQILSISGNGFKEQIARHPNTPSQVLEQLIASPGSARQAVSRNPNAPASALAELAQDSNSVIRGWVAENPNTPVDILVQLASQPVDKTNKVLTVEAVLKNPNFPSLERYRLVLTKELEQETAKAHGLMAQRTDSSYGLAQVLEKGDRNAKLTAARTNRTPIQVLEQLAKDSDEAVRQTVCQNSNLPLNSLLKLAKDESVNVRLWLTHKSSHQKISKPVQLLELLAQDRSEQVRARVAGLSDTPVEILVRLANDSSRRVKVALTENRNTPVPILTRLGLEENIVNQRNPNTPGMVLDRAVNTMNPKSLAEFIQYPVKGSQMPGETLARLATHSNSSVRYRVAQHPNTPVDALEPLLNDEYGPELWLIAERADIPPHYLERLLKGKAKNSKDYEQITIRVGDRAVIPPNLLETLMESNQERVYRRIAAQPNLPEAILEKLLATSSDSVLTTLAVNKTLSSEFLSRLANLPSPNVCRAITNHPNMTLQLFPKLVQSPDVSVRMAIATNSSTPVNILEILARDLDKDVRAKIASNSSSTIGILAQLAQDEDASVRTAVASNPNLSDTILTQLAQDQKVEVRRAVAQNPHTPNSIRETLQELVSPPQTKQTSPTLRDLPRIYNPQTDDLATVLSEYARSPNAFVRLVTLLHPLTPGEILQQGATSISWLERYAVAENPATPTELRQQLAEDSNRIVRAVANTNLST